MARASAQRQVNNFVGGLVTEAGPINFPENSLSVAENVVINRDGSLSSRKAFSKQNFQFFIGAGTPQGFLNSALFEARGPSDGDDVAEILNFEFHHWQQRDAYVIILSYLSTGDRVTTFGDTSVRIRFAVCEVEEGGVLRTRFTNETLQLNRDNRLGWNVVTTDDEMFFFGNLFSIYRYKWSTNEVITPTTSNVERLRYRDFKGVPNFRDATLTSFAEPTETGLFNAFTLYNLYNAGWPTSLQDAIAFNTSTGGTERVRERPLELVSPNRMNAPAWPAQTSRYYDYITDQASNADDLNRWSAKLLHQDSLFQNQRPLTGRVIDQYGSDTIRNLPGIGSLLNPARTIPLKSEFSSYRDPDHDINNTGVRCMDYIAGRMWYHVGGRSLFNIMFSQIDDSTDENWFTKCYQEADPTHPEINDLVDTDGGTLNIPDAGNIYRFIELGNSILVIAERGIWNIRSTGRSFIPTDISIEKVSNYRCLNRNCVKEIPNGISVGTQDGLVFIGLDQLGNPEVQNISDQRIKTLWNRVSAGVLNSVKSGIEYDAFENRIIVYYGKNSSTVSGIRTLVFNLSTDSFYEWEIDPMEYNADGLSLNPQIQQFTGVPMWFHSSTETPLTCFAFAPGHVGLQWNGFLGNLRQGDSQTQHVIGGFELPEDGEFDEHFLERPYDLNLPTTARRFDSIAEIPFDTIGNPSVDKIAEQVTLFMSNEGHLSNPTSSSYSAPGAELLWKWGYDRNFKPDNRIVVGRVKQYPYQEHYLDKEVLIDKPKLRGRGEELTLRFKRVIGSDAGYKILGYIIDYTGADRP